MSLFNVKGQCLYYQNSFSPFVSRIDLNSLTNTVVRDPGTYIGELDIAFNKLGELFITGEDNLTGPILRIDTLSFPGSTEMHSFPLPIRGLCVDRNDIFWASDWNSSGGLYSFDPTTNIETFHGNIGYSVTDLEYYNGNLYAIGWENDVTYDDDILILVDINNPGNSRIVMRLTLPFAFFSLASFNDSCGSNKLVAPGNGVLVFLNPEINTFDIINVGPNFAPEGAASKTGWMGSIPPLKIDSVTILPNPCTNLATIVVHPHSGRSGYQFALNNGSYQFDPIFEGLPPGTYTINLIDNGGCIDTFGPFEIHNMKSDSLFVLNIKPDYCNLNIGQLEISNQFEYDDLEYSLNELTWQSSSTFDQLEGGDYNVFIRFPSGCLDTLQVNIPILPPLVLNTLVFNENCNMLDGSVEFLVQGGHEPYQYGLIQNSVLSNQSTIDSLSSGDYEIIVIDSFGCSINSNINIDEITPKIVSISMVQPLCSLSNGSIYLEVSGGTLPYLYSINSKPYQSISTFDQLVSGTYFVSIVDAVGCQLDTTISLISMTNDSGVFAEVINASCDLANGSIILHSSQDKLLFSLNQSTPQSDTNFTHLNAGIYIITVMDLEGCSDTIIANLFQLGKPNLTNADTSPEHCDKTDGILTIEAITGGTSPYVYKIGNLPFQSSPIFYQLEGGEYNIMVKDANSCVDTFTTIVPEINGPIITSIEVFPSHCNSKDGTIEIEAVSELSLVFSLNQYTSNIGIFNQLQPGQYSLIIEDSFGCFVTKDVYIPDSISFLIEQIIINDASCQNKNGSIEIKSSGTDISITIDEIPNQVWDNIIQSLPTGTYHLNIKDAYKCAIDTTISIFSSSDCTITMPNVFSPDGNGINDVFGIYSSVLFAQWKLTIFDRSGNMIFYSEDPSLGWKGDYKEQLVQSGVYTWHLQYKISGDEIEYFEYGDVTVLR